MHRRGGRHDRRGHASKQAGEPDRRGEEAGAERQHELAEPVAHDAQRVGGAARADLGEIDYDGDAQRGGEAEGNPITTMMAYMPGSGTGTASAPNDAAQAMVLAIISGQRPVAATMRA